MSEDIMERMKALEERRKALEAELYGEPTSDFLEMKLMELERIVENLEEQKRASSERQGK